MIANSIASHRASISAVKVLFTTLFNLLDHQAYGIYCHLILLKRLSNRLVHHFKFSKRHQLKLNDELLRYQFLEMIIPHFLTLAT